MKVDSRSTIPAIPAAMVLGKPSAASVCHRLCLLLAWLLGAGLTGTAGAQVHSGRPSSTIPVALRFSATEANSPPGSCGCFFLLGGAADIALPLHRSLTVDVEAAGQHAGSVPGTIRGLSTITLLAGPRYRIRLPRLQSVFAQALFGAARGFDADFRRGTNAVDTATAFGYAVGGGYELPIANSLTLRPLQLDYAQTNLPNGSDNRQRNIRIGAGIVFQIGSLGAHR